MILKRDGRINLIEEGPLIERARRRSLQATDWYILYIPPMFNLEFHVKRSKLDISHAVS